MCSWLWSLDGSFELNKLGSYCADGWCKTKSVVDVVEKAVISVFPLKVFLQDYGAFCFSVCFVVYLDEARS